MFVLSRVVVGLARQKKELKRETFFVLGIPYWTFMYWPSIGQAGACLADGRVVSQQVIG